MYKIRILIFLAIAAQSAYGQINLKLKAELDSIYRIDQLYREIMESPERKDSLAKANNLSSNEVYQLIADRMTAIDQSNADRVKKIFKKFGYPGASLVGMPTNEAAWYVIQHSKNIEEYLPMMEEAGTQKELPLRLVAMMQDRMLMHQGKEQVYGSQVRCQGSECYVWPIADPAGVNQRRRDAGFDSTVEENAKRLGVTYEVRKLPK